MKLPKYCNKKPGSKKIRTYKHPFTKYITIFRYTFHPIDYTKLRQRFNNAVKKRADDLKKIGDGVTPFGQYLFDKLVQV